MMQQVAPMRTVEKQRCRPEKRRRKLSCCFEPKEPPDRPDPAIYSQEELLSQGSEPTWNSPDITTNSWGPWRLLEEMRVKVRNLSGTASAINVLVVLEVAPFGIGTPRTSIGGQFTNLAPNQETELRYPLPQSVLTGDQRLATHVGIQHSADKYLGNNRGAQTIMGVFTSEAGRTLDFQFPVRNPLGTPQQITLSVLSNDLGASVTPTSHAFAPLEQIDVKLHLSVPGTIHGTPGSEVRREITVVGWGQDGRAIGGLTHIILIND